MERQIITPKDMQLDDTVRMVRPSNEVAAFDTCIVEQIKDGKVKLFRPYGTTADFSYTGGVICYIGIEQYELSIDHSTMQYLLLERQKLK